MSLASLEWGGAAGRRKRGFGGFVLDMPLLLILFAIVGLGMVVLYSAVSAESGLLLRQALRFGVGLAAFFVVAQIPPHYLRIFTPWLYLLGVGLLLVVAVEGEIGKGAQRWLDLGVIRFQPSELLKLAVPMMCAWFVHERRLPPTFPQLMVMGLIVLTPVILIGEQPDLGTALLVLAAGGLTILLAGISVPSILAAVDRTRGAGAARYLASRMALARARAVGRSTMVALRFESGPRGTSFSMVEDGNGDGVRTRDIDQGIDRVIEAPVLLSDLFPGASIGLAPGTPTTVAVALGGTTILSFSPIGTATSGSIYVVGRDRTQWVVRVLGVTARARVLRYDRGTNGWVSAD